MSENRPPVRPRRLKVRVVDEGDRLRFSFHAPQYGGGCFMVLWLIGWTVGCVWLAGMAINEPKFFIVLFAVPFWASWFFVFFVLLRTFLQREELSLGAAGVDFVQRVIVTVRRRHIPLDEVRTFREYEIVTDRESGRRAWGIEIVASGRSLRVFQEVPEQERAWLIAELKRCLAGLKPPVPGDEGPMDDGAEFGSTPGKADRETATAEKEDEKRRAKKSELGNGEVEVLRPSGTPVGPPSDCGWQQIDEFRATGFAQRGRMDWGAVGGMLFVNLFWNGIVSVFISSLFVPEMHGPEGAMWWGLVVFLIPFEVIGLAMFVGLVAVLLEPVRRATWRFSEGVAEYRWTYFGFGPRWTYPIDRPDRIELRRSRENQRPGFRLSIRQATWSEDANGADRQLVLVGLDNTEVCTIDALTDGEARWIGDILLAERFEWFRA
ncbi:MAG: hypothetical protein HUU20_04970 [Pirellulales bacterium]|nr:hypothetical protein [Pirellulales bacterium]